MVENRNFQPKSLSTSTHPIRNEIFEAEDGNRAIRCVQVTQDEYDALVVERDRLRAAIAVHDADRESGHCQAPIEFYMAALDPQCFAEGEK